MGRPRLPGCFRSSGSRVVCAVAAATSAFSVFAAAGQVTLTVSPLRQTRVDREEIPLCVTVENETEALVSIPAVLTLDLRLNVLREGAREPAPCHLGMGYREAMGTQPLKPGEARTACFRGLSVACEPLSVGVHLLVVECPWEPGAGARSRPFGAMPHAARAEAVITVVQATGDDALVLAEGLDPTRILVRHPRSVFTGWALSHQGGGVRPYGASGREILSELLSDGAGRVAAGGDVLDPVTGKIRPGRDGEVPSQYVAAAVAFLREHPTHPTAGVVWFNLAYAHGRLHHWPECVDAGRKVVEIGLPLWWCGDVQTQRQAEAQVRDLADEIERAGLVSSTPATGR